MAHLKRARTHSENRSILCGLCFPKEKDLRLINDTHITQIKSLVNPSYDLSDPKFQKVLCKSCILSLSSHSKNPECPDRGRKLYKPCYDNLMQPPTYNTRTCDGQLCPCTVCKIAAENLNA